MQIDPNTFPTKGNLIAVGNPLGPTYTGYGLMGKKWNILIREPIELIDEAEGIQPEIDNALRAAHAALQETSIELGTNYVQGIGAPVSVDDWVKAKVRSIMGTEAPLAQYKSRPLALTYGFYNTTESLDEARYHFERVKELAIKLSMVENSICRLVNSIKRTQKWANTLKNIIIPHYEDLSKSISNALEGKGREKFTRLKVIKHNEEKVQGVLTYTPDDLVGITVKLRSSKGYSWDREQTFKDLKECLSNKAQEVFQAIDSDDVENLYEEPGDALLQVILNGQIVKEEGRFTINGVADGLCRKTVRRHSHVFGGVRVNFVEEGTALRNQIKMQEKAKKP